MYVPLPALSIPRMERSSYGAQAPKFLSLAAEDGNELIIEPVSVIEKGLFESRLIAEMSWTSPDRVHRKIFSVVDLVTPDLMRSRTLRWLADRRIGRNGKGPFY